MAAHKQDYIVTQDVWAMMDRWCQEKGYRNLPRGFYDDLLRELVQSLEETCFAGDPNVQVIGRRFEEVGRYLRKDGGEAFSEDVSKFWISLDDVYATDADYHIRVTRICDSTGMIDHGRGPRGDSHETLAEQAKKCSRAMRRDKHDEAVLVDDGAWDGKTITTVWGLLASKGVRVSKIRVCTATDEAYRHISRWQRQKKLPDYGWQAKEVKSQESGIRDWVCERDFYVGIPRSGRIVGTKQENEDPRVHPVDPCVSIAYTYPYGKPDKWASLHSELDAFSTRALERSIRLWEEFSKENNCKLRVKDMPTVPVWMYRHGSETFAKWLECDWCEALKQHLAGEPPKFQV